MTLKVQFHFQSHRKKIIIHEEQNATITSRSRSNFTIFSEYSSIVYMTLILIVHKYSQPYGTKHDNDFAKVN